MSGSPVNAMFEMQRAMIKSGQTAVEGSVRIQQNAAETFLQGIDRGLAVQRSGLDLSRRAVHAQLDALGSALPAAAREEIEAAVDEQYDAVEQVNADVWEAVESGLSEWGETVDDLSETQLEMLNEAVEAYLEAQTDAEKAADEAAAAVEDAFESVEA